MNTRHPSKTLQRDLNPNRMRGWRSSRAGTSSWTILNLQTWRGMLVGRVSVVSVVLVIHACSHPRYMRHKCSQMSAACLSNEHLCCFRLQVSKNGRFAMTYMYIAKIEWNNEVPRQHTLLLMHAKRSFLLKIRQPATPHTHALRHTRARANTSFQTKRGLATILASTLGDEKPSLNTKLCGSTSGASFKLAGDVELVLDSLENPVVRSVGCFSINRAT